MNWIFLFTPDSCKTGRVLYNRVVINGDNLQDQTKKDERYLVLFHCYFISDYRLFSQYVYVAIIIPTHTGASSELQNAENKASKILTPPFV